MSYYQALAGPLDLLGADQALDAAFDRFVESEAARRLRMELGLALVLQTLIVVGAVAVLTRGRT